MIHIRPDPDIRNKPSLWQRFKRWAKLEPAPSQPSYWFGVDYARGYDPGAKKDAKIAKLEKKVARLQRRCRELLHPDYGLLECAVTAVDYENREMEIRPVDPDPVRRDIKATIDALTRQNLDVFRENERLTQELRRLRNRGTVNFLGANLTRKDP